MSKESDEIKSLLQQGKIALEIEAGQMSWSTETIKDDARCILNLEKLALREILLIEAEEAIIEKYDSRDLSKACAELIVESIPQRYLDSYLDKIPIPGWIPFAKTWAKKYAKVLVIQVISSSIHNVINKLNAKYGNDWLSPVLNKYKKGLVDIDELLSNY